MNASFDTQSNVKELNNIEKLQAMTIKKFCAMCGQKLLETHANCPGCNEEIGNDKVLEYQELLKDI